MLKKFLKFLLIFLATCPLVEVCGLHTAVQRPGIGKSEEGLGPIAFENVIKNIFNNKKNAVVRVVCIPRMENGSKDELNMRQMLAGTGFFVSDRAEILTAASIVKNAQRIWVDYKGASYTAECIGLDLATNIAILRLLQPPINFDVVDIRENNVKKMTEIGSFVVFVGCKMGMDPLPDIGHVCGKNISYSDNDFLTTYLRTNLTFCGGESGAPVFELNGDLAGVMIASLPEVASSFILPKRVVSNVYKKIIKEGSIKHRKLAIETRTSYVFGQGQQVVICKIFPNAADSGLLVGDVIKRVEDSDVVYREDFFNAVFFAPDDVPLVLKVVRDGNELSFVLKDEYFQD